MLDSQAVRLVTAISTGAIATGLIISILKKSKELGCSPKKWVRVGEVSQLNIHPIKSCRAVSVDEATATSIGLQASEHLRDRVFVVVTSDGTFRTQRQLPRMALISVSIQDNFLTLRAPEIPEITITIPEFREDLIRPCRIFTDKVKINLDCGDEVAEWLSKFLQVDGLRLYFHPGTATQREVGVHNSQFPLFRQSDTGSYQDRTSFSVISEESIEELNESLETPVSARNFRPVILIKDVPDPFAEDIWSYIRIGDDAGPIFKAASPCTRCKMTTNDPEVGEFDKHGEPLNTLTKIQRSFGNEKVDELCKNYPIMGNLMGLWKAGNPIRVGDPVYAAVL